MDGNMVIYLGRHTLETALLVSAPLLIVCVVVGIVVSIVQAVTSIKDSTLSIIPKLVAMAVATLLFGGWMLEVLLKFTTEMFGIMQNIGH
jgi:flagellar biosynthesis protein FliQ